MTNLVAIERLLDGDGDLQIKNLEPLRDAGIDFLFGVTRNGDTAEVDRDQLEVHLRYSDRDHELFPARIDYLDDLAYWLFSKGYAVSVRFPGEYPERARVYRLDGYWDSFYPSYSHVHYGAEEIHLYCPGDPAPRFLAATLDPGDDLERVLADNLCTSLECLDR